MWINKNHADYWAHCPTEHKEEGVHGVYRTLEVRHMSHCRRGQYVWVPYYSDREPRKEWDDTLGGGVKKKRVLIWLLIMCKVRKKQRLGKRKWSFQGRVCTDKEWKMLEDLEHWTEKCALFSRHAEYQYLKLWMAATHTGNDNTYERLMNAGCRAL